MSQGTAEPVVARPDAWVGGVHRWDSYFAVVLAGTLALLVVADSAPESSRLVAGLALIAMVPWYLLVGRRVMYGDYQAAWAGPAYLAGLIALLSVAEIWAGTNTLILLALCPQCFTALPYRRAIAAVVVMNIAPVIIAVARGDHGPGLESAIGIAVLTGAFCIVFGTWIIKIIEQSAERADLITQLERTRAELAQANREAGIMAERERLASEIHDTIAQGFTSIVMLAQAADAMLGADPQVARGQLDLIARTARENLAEARALVAGLGPAPLEVASLADALARLADRTAAELGLTPCFTVHGEPRSLRTGAQVVLLRVCQEALSNARQHARASSVTVSLSYRADVTRLEVTDDGIGFDPGAVVAGYGLRGMRARVAEIGGELMVVSSAGSGTMISAEVT